MDKFTFVDIVDWVDDDDQELKDVMWGCRHPQMDCKAIEENKDKEATDYYVQIEVSFDKNNALYEVLVLIQDCFGDDDWVDNIEGIGEEIKEKGKVVGHTLLSNDEFTKFVKMSLDKLNEIK